jgi:hypothetical protein
MASSFGKLTPLAKLKVVPVQKPDGKTLLLLRGNAYFGKFLMSHAGSHGVRLKPVHGAEDFPSLHWMVRAGLVRYRSLPAKLHNVLLPRLQRVRSL